MGNQHSCIMSVYIGGERKNFILGNTNMNILGNVVLNGTALKSHEGYLLKDYNGQYLIAKESV